MMASSTGIISVSNETTTSASRITREGRRISYHAEVIQQPERARACGSGAKSCADRRPVDPPPIIELRIYEGNAGSQIDITEQYNANFFMFATLENARHIAPGRGQGASQTLPVLTGSPVAGMSLLDRPHKAGYFIFPDLSVRHEGKYRLNFSLYEELKHHGDMDPETAMEGPTAKSAHVSHRLEVKTAPFTVFSAKKFPGLAESTQLSKTFAEQGCRVRIRREVRQRKRNEKDEEDYSAPNESNLYERSKPSATPEYRYPQSQANGTPHPQQSDPSDRARSASIHSNGGQHVRHGSHEQPAYQQVPRSPAGSYPPQGQWPQPPPPTSASYPAPTYQQYDAPPPPMAPPHGYQAPQSYQAPYPHEMQHARNGSMGYPQAPPPPQGPPRSATTPQSPQVPQTQYASYPSYSQHQPHVQNGASHVSPPPPSPYSNGHPPATMSHAVPIPPQPSYVPIPVADQPVAVPPMPTTTMGYPAAPAVANNKRSYGSSFDTQALEQPLRSGARPMAISMDPSYNYQVASSVSVDTDDEGPIDLSNMSYRRADGSSRRRHVPKPVVA